MLLCKFEMGCNRVFTDSDNYHIFGLKVLISTGKSTRLPRTSGSVILGIEIQYNLLAQKVGQANGIAILVGQGKFRCFRTYFSHISFSFSLVWKAS